MAIPKIEPRSILQKLRQVILGNEKPNFLTRISVLIGFFAWIYFFSWYLLTIGSIFFIDTLPQPHEVQGFFDRVGSKLYGWGSGATKALMIHAIAQSVIYFLILVGLIMIYRKKRLGFLFFIIGNALTFLVTFILLGSKFLVNETGVFDLLLTAGLMVYFGIGAWYFYKWKPRKKSKEDVEAVQETAPSS